MSKLDIYKRPVIFGHRGACAHAPENTLAAFRLALEQGADAVELDAKLAADGTVMVIHDQTVDRTTNGHGKVMEMTLGELKELDAGSKFSPEFAGEKIPTLAEVFQTVGNKMLINVELTNYASIFDDLPDRVADLVRSCGVENSVMFSSFNPRNLSRIRKVLPGAETGMLAWIGGAGGWQRSFIGRWVAPGNIHPYYSDVTREFVTREHNRKRNINVWTVNDPAEMRRLQSLGVDGIMTDSPKTALEVLGRK